MEKISSRRFDLADSHSTSDLKGKNVVSRGGEIVGKVKDVLFYDKDILGVILKKRFRKDVFIGIEMVASITQDAILLSIDPVTSLLGLPVFDKAGKKIGKVKGIVRQDERNGFKSIAVKPNIFKRTLEIDAQDIKIISQHIILKVEI